MRRRAFVGLALVAMAGCGGPRGEAAADSVNVEQVLRALRAGGVVVGPVGPTTYGADEAQSNLFTVTIGTSKTAAAVLILYPTVAVAAGHRAAFADSPTVGYSAVHRNAILTLGNALTPDEAARVERAFRMS